MKKRTRRKIRNSIKFLLWTGVSLILIFVQTRLNVFINAADNQFYCGMQEHLHEIDCYKSVNPLCGVEEHTHGSDCFEQALICTLENGQSEYSLETAEIEIANDGNLAGENGSGNADENTAAENLSEASANESAPANTEGTAAGHDHDSSCYEERLICTKEVHEHADICMTSRTPLCNLPEHQHELLCTSNPKANVEDEEDWEKQLKDLPEAAREKILEIASRQIGYQESEQNFTIDELGKVKGYTRYGQFAQDLYADWNLYFISYVLHYADASVFEEITDEAGNIETQDLYLKSRDEWLEYADLNPDYIKPLNYNYKEGDLVYVDVLDENAEYSQTLGIITKVDEETRAITAVFGDFYNEVVEAEVNEEDFTIRGYIAANVDDENNPDAAGQQDESVKETDFAELTDETIPAEENAEEASGENTEEQTDSEKQKPDEGTAKEEDSEEKTEPIVLPEDVESFTRIDDKESNVTYLIPETTSVDKGDFTIDLAIDKEKTEEGNLEVSSLTREEAVLFIEETQNQTEETSFASQEEADEDLIAEEKEDLTETELEKEEELSNISEEEQPVNDVESSLKTGVNEEETMAAEVETVADTDANEVDSSILDEQPSEEELPSLSDVLPLDLNIEEQPEIVVLDPQVIKLDSKNPEIQSLQEVLDEETEENEVLDQSGYQLVLKDQNHEDLETEQIVLNADITPTKDYIRELENDNDIAPVEIGDNTVEVLVYTEEADQIERKGYSSGNEIKPVSVTVRNRAVFAASAASINPSFTVEYYTEMDVIVTESDDANNQLFLNVMDTSKKANKSTGPVLPQNTPDSRATVVGTKIYLENADNEYDTQLSQSHIYIPKTEKQYVETYAAETMNYIDAPNLSYMEKKAQTDSYILKYVWVKNPGDSDWSEYEVDKIHFTNNAEVAANSNGLYTLISQDTVIRLIYAEVNFGEVKFDTKFYDYDITHAENWGNPDDVGKQSQWKGAGFGINSHWIYPENSPIKLAFGNHDPGSGYEEHKINIEGTEYYINRFNTLNNSSIYGYATFGMVEKQLNTDTGTPQFISQIGAPEIFGSADIVGKTIYDGTLGFTRHGDNYTIYSAQVDKFAAITDLNQFKYLKDLDANLFKFYDENGQLQSMKVISNNFWPFDEIYNVDNHYGSGDVRFYHNDNTTKRYMTSDDGKDHNNNFGMEFTIDFSITSDYKGPLEYRFFGDDDLWVYLDNELIIDIGGVHSSIGQVADLWDYLKDENGVVDDGPHQLKVFYTERGLYGSTCFMEFTLPSASAPQVRQLTNALWVEKQGENIAPDEEFSFTIEFEDESGNKLIDNYKYDKYQSGDTTPIEKDLVVNSGAHFVLSKDQYIVIQYLPIGTKFTVKEVDIDPTEQITTSTLVTPAHEYQLNENRTVSGVISTDTAFHSVFFKNSRAIVMPETGGEGISWFLNYGLFTFVVGGIGITLCLRSKEE